MKGAVTIMDLSIIETIGKSSKTGQTVFRVKATCACCGKEMTPAMEAEMYAECGEHDADLFCQDCVISEGMITECKLKKMKDEFYLVLFRKPDKNYKGQKPCNYHKYLQSEHWKAIRNEAIERAGGRCQLCNKPGILHVHHRTYENVSNEKPGDLIVLCGHCHAKFHDKLN